MKSGPKLSEIKQLDLLYLDATYCNPIYEFPLMKEASSQVIEIINRHPAEFRVMIGMDTIGKERLLFDLISTFNTKVRIPILLHN